MSDVLASSDEPIDRRPPPFHGKAKGGRPPGRKNRSTLVREKFAKDGLADAEASGMSPLAIMLLGVREPGKVSNLRFERAKAAAPYVHATYRAIAFRDTTPPKDTIDLTKLTAAELSMLRKVLQRTAPVADVPQIEGQVLDPSGEEVVEKAASDGEME